MSDYWNGYNHAMAIQNIADAYTTRSRTVEAQRRQAEYIRRENEHIQRENAYAKTIDRMRLVQHNLVGTIANYSRGVQTYDRLIVDVVNALAAGLPKTKGGAQNIGDIANILKVGKALGEPEADTAEKLIEQLRKLYDRRYDKARASAPEDDSDTNVKKIVNRLEEFAIKQIP